MCRSFWASKAPALSGDPETLLGLLDQATDLGLGAVARFDGMAKIGLASAAELAPGDHSQGETDGHEQEGRDDGDPGCQAVSPRPAAQEFPAGRRADSERLLIEPPPQLVGEGAGGREAVLGTFLQRLQADRLQVPGDRRVERPGGGGLLGGDPGEESAERVGLLERQLAGEHAVEDHAEAVDVATTIGLVRPSLGLLGRHVGRGAQDLTVDRQGAAVGDLPRQTEVGELGLTRFVDEDVRGLDVAVDDPLACA